MKSYVGGTDVERPDVSHISLTTIQIYLSFDRQRLFQYTWPRNEYRPQYRACSHEDTRHTGAYRMWITCLKEERSTTHAQTATLSVLRSRRRRLTLEIGSSILQIGSHLD